MSNNNLDTADEAYEWNLGQYMRSNGTFTYELSKDLANEYANYINQLKLKNPNGDVLTLKESDIGIYTSGSYYDYILSITEESLNNFLNDTSFPYTPSSSNGGVMPSGGMPSEAPTDNGGGIPSGNMNGGSMPSSEVPMIIWVVPNQVVLQVMKPPRITLIILMVMILG